MPTTDSLRILLFYDCLYPESLGGVEHRNYEIAVALSARGHRVTLAGWSKSSGLRGAEGKPDHGEEEPAEKHAEKLKEKPKEKPEDKHGVELLPLRFRTELYGADGKRRSTASARLALAATAVDLGRFDVVEAANIPFLHLLPLAARCRWSGTPLVVAWYEYWGRYWREYVGAPWPAFAAVEWGCAQLGSAASAISELTASRVRRAALSSKPVEVLPSGVPFERIRRAAVGPMALGSASLDGGDLVSGRDGAPLVYAGRLHREKRLDLLLRAVAEIEGQPAGRLLSVIGDGPDRARLQALTADLGLEDRVEFRGRVPTSEGVWQHIARSRIAVQPSSREGFGMFPLEAMAAGLPVIHCRSEESAVSELVRHSVDGLCVEPSASSLAGALSELLADEERRRAMSESAVERAAGYDWSVLVERFERLYRRVAELPT